jgi:hypothetical protein
MGPWVFTPADRIIARDEAGALKHLVATRQDRRGGKAKAQQIALAACPLAFMNSAPSLAILKEVAGEEDEIVRIVAAHALVKRGDPAGKDVLLEISTRHGKAIMLSKDIAGRMMEMITERDLPALRQLAKVLSAATQETVVEGSQRWVLVASALMEAKDGQSACEKAMGLPELLVATRPADSQAATQGTVQQKVCEMSAVADAAELYCTPRMADFLIANAWQAGHPITLSEIVRAMARCPQRRAQVADFIADKLLTRPAPLLVKLAIIDISRDLKDARIDAAIDRWAKSKNPFLARAAVDRSSVDALVRHGF